MYVVYLIARVKFLSAHPALVLTELQGKGSSLSAVIGNRLNNICSIDCLRSSICADLYNRFL